MPTTRTRDLLRSLKSLAGPFEPFDITQTPASPQDLFLVWLERATAAGIIEPHAMTLSTVDEDGHPDARVLILKDLDENGWHFAISAASPKGRQLALEPSAALTFYWHALGRQVRIRGTARRMDKAANTADFLARPIGSRAGALMARQSDILHSPADLDAALAIQHQRLEQQPDLVAPAWTVYALRPSVVEFWQGDQQRRHTRLRYARIAAGWDRQTLWP